MTDELRIGKGFEGNSRGIIEVLSQNLSGAEENHEKH
jgi:hypothetical protein